MSNQLIRALCRPGVLGGKGPATLIETHISYVLLSGRFAYKIKKPVNLGFVDFSTLENRMHFCLEELRLNRRLAAELYLGVVRITGSIDHPSLDGPGLSLEFAVKMKRFPHDSELKQILARNLVNPRHLKRLASELARFHDSADCAAPNSRFASTGALCQRALDNFSDISEQIRQPDIVRQLVYLKRWTLRSLKTHESEFEKRKRNLRIKECHGDLHLGNLVLIEERIIPFDCLEFNEEFRWIDVASEIAFLLMDLCAHKYETLANQVLNCYLEESADYEMLPLLRHYMVYRAMVLVKVARLRTQQASTDKSASKKIPWYLDMAEQIARQRPNKRLIITHGLSGCGKTWLSERLIGKSNAIRVRSDVVRKQLHGIDIAAPSGSALKKGIYRPEANSKVYGELGKIAGVILDSGRPAIIDATFLMKKQRHMFRKIAEKHKASFHILHLEAPESVLIERITTRQRMQSDASEAGLTVLENQIRDREVPEVSEVPYCVNVRTDRQWTDKAIRSVLKKLRLA